MAPTTASSSMPCRPQRRHGPTPDSPPIRVTHTESAPTTRAVRIVRTRSRRRLNRRSPRRSSARPMLAVNLVVLDTTVLSGMSSTFSQATARSTSPGPCHPRRRVRWSSQNCGPGCPENGPIAVRWSPARDRHRIPALLERRHASQRGRGPDRVLKSSGLGRHARRGYPNLVRRRHVQDVFGALFRGRLQRSWDEQARRERPGCPWGPGARGSPALSTQSPHPART